MVTNQVVDYIYQAHGRRLTQWNNLLLNPAALQRYADAIARKGAPLENCFGFVDCTVWSICRPNENQSTVYNGHKRVHALKFQSVTIPNGLYGPVGIKVVTCIYLLIFFSRNLSLSCTLPQIMCTFRSTEELMLLLSAL